MVGTMSLAGREAVDLRESSRSYRGWHPECFEVTGSEASTRPLPHAHYSKSRMSRPVRISKNIKPLEG